MAAALDEIALPPEAVSALAEQVPEAFLEILEEGLEMCADIHGTNGEVAAEALFDLAVELCNEVTSEQVVHADIGVDDTVITRRTLPDGTIRETRRPLKGTIKEMVRGLRTSIPIFKLLQADAPVREYLLYCAISLVAALGQPLSVPAGTLV